MRSYEEFERLIYSGGDMLFSCVLARTGSREKALEVICLAAEDYLESRKRLRNQNERYRLLSGCCRKILKAPLRNDVEKERLTDSERERILASAKLYIAGGGKLKKRLASLTFIVVAVIVLAVVAACAISFFYSEQFGSGAANMF